jgi:hypothetical protein
MGGGDAVTLVLTGLLLQVGILRRYAAAEAGALVQSRSTAHQQRPPRMIAGLETVALGAVQRVTAQPPAFPRDPGQRAPAQQAQ